MFSKVVGKVCQQECELRDQMKEASAYLCESCGKELTPITRTRTGALVGAAVGGILLMGGLGWGLRAFVLNPRPEVRLPVDGKPIDPAAKALTVQYAVQSEDEGRPRNVPADHSFRSGDRFRIILKGAAPTHYYVFYEDRRNDQMEILYPEGTSRQTPADEVISVPPGNGDWVTLDQNPGTERFILVAAAAPLDELDLGGSNCPRSRFDAAMEKIKSKYGLTEAKSASDLDWMRVESKGTGVLMTRFSLQHQ